MKVHILMGTNNPGKLADAKAMAKDYPEFSVYSPEELGISLDPKETGDSYAANAHIKRDAFAEELKKLGLDNYFIISDDGGLEIDALGGAPGIHSRRWKDGTSSMSDQEIVDYCLEQMKNVPDDKRSVAFVGIVSVFHPANTVNLDIPYRLEGTMLKSAEDVRRFPGYPFRALFYLPQYKMLLHDIVSLPRKDRPDGFMAHREIGLKKAYDAIKGVAL